jgi:uncharacterized protein (DUF427 family)
MDKPKRIPGPDHPITVEPSPDHVTVTFGGKKVADSRRTLALKEASYPVVHYVPREDVDMSLLERTAHATYCPYKGDCAYYSVRAGGDTAENAVWTYESPYDAVRTIKDHVAFYPNRVALKVER